jgi:hypothetical protein
MDKRNLFEELQAGLEDVKAFEEEKITLKTMTIEPKERKVLEASEIRAMKNSRKNRNSKSKFIFGLKLYFIAQLI